MSRSTIFPIPSGLDVFEEHEIKKLNKKGIPTIEQKNMLKLIEKITFNSPTANEVVTATYIGSDKSSYLLDGGYKDYIRIPMRPSEVHHFKNYNIGDSIDVYLDKYNESPFDLEGSISSLQESKARNAISNLPKDAYVLGTIKASTPAGYTVNIIVDGIMIEGFMPNTLADVNKLVDPESIVGKQLELMVESYSDDEGTYIVSRRRYLQSLIPKKIKELEHNKVYTGFVTGTTDYGVFVQFEEYLTGMIHKTNIHPEWADKLSEIQPGTEIDFYVKEVNKQKIILTQILKDSLWDTISPNEQYKGTVIVTKSFGTLVSLDVDTMGLIPNDDDKKTYQAGSKLNVKVLSVDRDNRKMTLTVV